MNSRPEKPIYRHKKQVYVMSESEDMKKQRAKLCDFNLMLKRAAYYMCHTNCNISASA